MAENIILRGKIIKSIAGFYEVYTDAGLMGGTGGPAAAPASGREPGEGEAQPGGCIYRCRAKGLFRERHQKPLVGDDVRFQVTDLVSVPPEGNVVELLPRRNELVRPYVANVDQACLLFAITRPEPSFQMLDRFLISLRIRQLPVILCFNKADLAEEEQIRALQAVYEACGCRVLFLSVREDASLEAVRTVLQGKTTVITGPSGAGKSSLINRLVPGGRQETGELSRKIARGRNTTRTVELLAAGGNTYLVDTPGFTSLYLTEIEAEEVKTYYPEFTPYAARCRFQGCNHMAEPDCAVKEAVRAGQISRIRYETYTEIFEELKNRKQIWK